MTMPDEIWWARARKARDQLASQVLALPNVIMVDIGQDPLGIVTTPVLRVHLRPDGRAGLKIPEVIDGIPVRVIQSDIRLQ